MSKKLYIDLEQQLSRMHRPGAKKPVIYEIMTAAYGGKLVPAKPPKKHYGMSAETIAARAPFDVFYCEEPVHITDYQTGQQSFELRAGYRVRDKHGDIITPRRSQLQSQGVAEELNLVAAKWLMENEGPPIRELEWDPTKKGGTQRYRK